MTDQNNRGRKHGSKNRKTVERDRLMALITALDKVITDPDATSEARVSACAMLLKLREGLA